MKTFAIPTNGKWVAMPSHLAWLNQQAESLFAFYERNIVNPLGGFYDLDDAGRPTAPGYGAGGTPARYLFATTRIVHAYSIAHLMGRPGADVIVDHGMDFLWKGHRDQDFGGYFWAVGYEGPVDSVKQAYGHAFVLLAASSAKVAGHPDAERLLADVTTDYSGTVLGGTVRSGGGRVHPGLARVRFLSWPELQYAPDGSADGGVRGDK